MALYYFFFLSSQLLAALDFLVLITYFNYTNQLKPYMAHSVMQSLRATISSFDAEKIRSLSQLELQEDSER